MALLEIRNIDCFYGDVQVIFGVSMHVDEGEVISLIGANGAGKSTLLRTVSGLMKPRSGEILFENEPVHDLRPEQIVDAAIQEDVDVVGLSILSGAHVALTAKVLEGLRSRGAGDILVLVGGVIPDDDRQKLLDMGVAAVYTSGAKIEDIAGFIRSSVRALEGGKGSR